MTNGYKIIDFKGIDLTDGAEIPGIYDAIDKSNKPLVIANLNGGGTILKPFFGGAVTKSLTEYLYIPLTIADGDGAATISIQIEPGDVVSFVTE